jgi:transcriptional regulator with XRE-family HTH domain
MSAERESGYREGHGYSLGENLSRLRTQRGYSKRQLAALANVSPSYLSNVEHGIVTNPGCFLIYRVALALRVTMEQLMGVSSLHSRGRISRGPNSRE